MNGPELGIAVLAIVAFAAGFIRGFAGFGGPAFLLAILALFYAPITVVGKVVVIDLVASSYLFVSIFREIKWRSTLMIFIGTLVTMPVGQWLLLNADADTMRQIISATLLVTSASLLLGVRYVRPMNTFVLIVLGLVAGVVLGATYIALIVVAAVLMGPYSRSDARTLIVSWGFLIGVCYAAMSIWTGTTKFQDVAVALPGALLYLGGTWLGSRWFRSSREESYRRIALVTLLALAILGFLK